MEVKPGYQQTEVGLIPNDWAVIDLSNFCLLQRGFDITEATRVAGDVPVYSSSGISYFHNTAPVFPPGVVTGRKGLLGRVFFIKEPFWPHDTTLWVRDFKGNHPQYVAFVLENFHLERLDAATSVPTLNRNNLVGYLIPYPPTKPEQEAIAEALSDADALIESLEQLIAKKRRLKQGAMQQLLTPKKGWYTQKLEGVADVIDPHPSHRAPAAVPNGIPFVGIGDLNENGDLIGNKIRTVDASVFDEHQNRYCLKDELLGLGRVASIGKVVKLKDTGAKYVISPTLGIIRGTKVRRDYLLYALKSRGIADQFTRIMSGSTRSSVGMVVLRKLDILLPREETDQTRIAAILSDMDAEISAIEAKLGKIHQLKQGMMHNLLTGRVRLV